MQSFEAAGRLATTNNEGGYGIAGHEGASSAKVITRPTKGTANPHLEAAECEVPPLGLLHTHHMVGGSYSNPPS